MADLINLLRVVSAVIGGLIALFVGLLCVLLWLAVRDRLDRRHRPAGEHTGQAPEDGPVGEPYQPDVHTDPATALEIVLLDALYHGPAYGEDGDR